MSACIPYSKCVVNECNRNAIEERKSFFRFPKEHDRWLKWIEACGRFDLKKMGIEYVHKRYRLCHLHFEKKWYKVHMTRTYLHPDAIPTIFSGKHNSQIEITREASLEETVEKKGENMQIEENIQTENITEINIPNISVLGDEQKRLSECDKMNNNHIIAPIQMSASDSRSISRITTQSSTESRRIQVQNSRKIQKLQQQIVKYKKKVIKLHAKYRRLLKTKQMKSKTSSVTKISDSETLRKLGPRAYRQLQKDLALPSVRTLQRLTETWHMKPGINSNIFKVLSMKLKSLPPLERHCILCVDEMSLKAHLFYNISQDTIVGFEDTGSEKSSLLAKQALVVMARSIAGVNMFRAAEEHICMNKKMKHSRTISCGIDIIAIFCNLCIVH